MRVAVVGAGFAGIATCFEALKAGLSVTLFDQGGGASRISPGFLHPFVGKQAIPDWENYHASYHLLEVAGQAKCCGLFRLFNHPIEREGAIWWGREEIEAHLPTCTAQGGLYIPDGLRIDAKRYLDTLLKICIDKGMKIENTQVEGAHLLSQFDWVFLCTGAGAAAFKHLKITPIKGQILRLAWPQAIPPPQIPIIGAKYLVMEGDTCLVGATYEREFADPEPDIAVAKALILPYIEALYPALKGAEVLQCLAGVRASAPGHYPPIICELEPRLWVLTGLGSRGLLLHARCAQELVRKCHL
ncbi:MAG: FAD-dependent oxidoreductase [Verrucomicrobia bacterium]|nr:FAD-dependent oxidoreductase [Verrucomicrobiota bacterium]